MQAIAIVVALAMASPPAAEAEPVQTTPVQTTPVRARPSTAPTEPPAPGERVPGDRMVQAGVGLVVAGLVGYGLMAVGLGIGNQAEGELLSLLEPGDIAARRKVLARGRVGNRLAIAGAITASAALAVGIPLIVLGRRRHEAASPRAMVVLDASTSGVGLRVRGRF